MLASEIARSLQLEALIRAEGNPCLAAFAETLERAADTSIELFLSRRPHEDRSHLASLIALDLRVRIARREPCDIESYFDRFPELRQDRDQVIDLIYAEFCERRKFQDDIESKEYYRRFPDYRESLERLFQIDSAIGGEEPLPERLELGPLKFPDAGDEFLDFRLLAELGRGAFGRVFLAEQTSLSDRRVVVKVTPLRTIEHQTLARMEHPNIVPIHSVHRDELSGLQAVCMPYQGAVALSDVIATWRDSGSLPTEAAVFIEAIHRLLPPQLIKIDPETDRAARFPIQENYVYACCWIMHRIAAALHNAHMRGIYHRDLKPSNILITASGQPLLVDFNLAFNEFEAGGDPAAFFGGTLPYMPPEQIRVLLPEEGGRADDVGPRSDIFSLAATMFELLTGGAPFDSPLRDSDRTAALRAQLALRRHPLPSARPVNSVVPWDLDALLSKCLRLEPHCRYETAGQLADDLGLLLQDRPLRCIGPTPRRKAVGKFLRRNRRRLVIGCAVTVMAIAIAELFHTAQRKTREAQFTAELERTAREAEEDKRIEVDTDAKTQVEAELLAARENAPDYGLGYEYFLIGYRYTQMRRYRHAIYAFDAAIAAGYEHHQAFFNRGHCHTVFDEDVEALEDFTMAIAKKPTYARAYLHRAITHASSRIAACLNPSQALADVDTALRLGPQRPDFFWDASRVYSCVAERSSEKARDALLKQSQDYLFNALDRGFTPNDIVRMHETDKYQMAKLVFARSDVRQRLGLSTDQSNP